MNLVSNINKIHFDLTEKFENVKLEEKSNIKFGKYFNISANSGEKQVKIILEFREVENNEFKWFYLENPIDENSELIERKSTLNSLIHDLNDIFEKNRFSEEYIISIKK